MAKPKPQQPPQNYPQGMQTAQGGPQVPQSPAPTPGPSAKPPFDPAAAVRQAEQDVHGSETISNAPGGGTRSAEQQAEERQRLEKSIDSKCPPGYPYRSTKEGDKGDCVEHPDNCSQGYQQWGNKCVPHGSKPGTEGYVGPGGGGPGGGGQGGQGGQDGGGMGRFSQFMSQYGPEQFQDKGLTNYFLGQLGIGGNARDNRQNQHAWMGPQTEALAGNVDQLRQQARSLGPGGAGARMFAQGAGNAANQASQLRGQMLESAQAGLGNLVGQQADYGQRGFATGAGLYGDLSGQANQYGISSMQDLTNRYGMGLQNQQFWGGLGQQESEFGRGLGRDYYGMNLQNQQFGQGLGQQESEFTRNLKEQQRTTPGRPSTAGRILSGIGGIVGGLFSSDMRLKENVKSYTPGLDAIKKMEPISYEYNGKAGTKKGQPAVSFSAQKLEKTLPGSVTKIDTDGLKGVRMLDLAKVCATMVNAIKELDEKLEELN